MGTLKLALPFFFSVITAYLLGSIPTSFIFAKLLKGIDITQYGSGNIGATNTLRILGKLPAIAVLLADILKGVIAVTIVAGYFLKFNIPVSEKLFKAMLGFSCVGGHCWMLFLGFKGGKGVATSLGVLLGLIKPVTSLLTIMGAGILIWGLVVYRFRYVSLGSIVVSLSMPILMIVFNQPLEYTLLCVTLCIIICYKHKSNIERLIKGQEHKIGEKITT